jgi:hypothetical protein
VDGWVDGVVDGLCIESEITFVLGRLLEIERLRTKM